MAELLSSTGNRKADWYTSGYKKRLDCQKDERHRERRPAGVRNDEGTDKRWPNKIRRQG